MDRCKESLTVGDICKWIPMSVFSLCKTLANKVGTGQNVDAIVSLQSGCISLNYCPHISSGDVLSTAISLGWTNGCLIRHLFAGKTESWDMHEQEFFTKYHQINGNRCG